LKDSKPARVEEERCRLLKEKQHQGRKEEAVGQDRSIKKSVSIKKEPSQGDSFFFVNFKDLSERLEGNSLKLR
jgi:hypothetical protein